MAPEIKAALAKTAPSIEFLTSKEVDHSYEWDGDGPDPIDDGQYPHDLTFTARTIVNGEMVEGESFLGGSYYEICEPVGDAHGYLLQQLKEAAQELITELRKTNGTSWLVNQLYCAIDWINAESRRQYELQRLELGDHDAT